MKGERTRWGAFGSTFVHENKGHFLVFKPWTGKFLYAGQEVGLGVDDKHSWWT